jgi:hypothetical protein
MTGTKFSPPVSRSYWKLAFLLLSGFFVAVPSLHAQPTFQTRMVQGWDIEIESGLLQTEPGIADGVLAELDQRLQEIVQLLPSKRVEELRRVPIFVLAHDGDRVAVYVTGAGPASEEGSSHPPDAELVGGVEIGNAAEFRRYLHDVPSRLLHELAHAYHAQIQGFDAPAITKAFQHAVSTGLYQSVPGQNGQLTKSYALTNEREYFALLTQAYYERSGYYPYTRDQLREYDPAGYDVVRSAWEDRAGPQPSIVASVAHPLACGSEKSRPGGEGASVTLAVRNRTNAPLNLIWIGYNGSKRVYGQISPGGFLVRRTFASNAWEVDTDTGTCILNTTVGPLGAHIEISN